MNSSVLFEKKTAQQGQINVSRTKRRAAASSPPVCAVTSRPMLYPVKKMSRQDHRSVPPFQESAEYSNAMDGFGRIKLAYSRSPLSLTRPSGTVFNLQAPVGVRSRTPLLCNSASPSTSNSSVPSPYSFSVLDSEHMNVTMSGVNNHERCRGDQNAAPLIFSPATQDLRSKIPTFPSTPVMSESELTGVSVPEARETHVHGPEEDGTAGFCCHSGGCESIIFTQGFEGGQRSLTLLSPPLSDAPCPSSLRVSHVSGIALPPANYCSVTPPAEHFPIQGNDIDYSLFDEFFVRS